ncbi:MAG: efflux RND transporter periplasmic adaptor subunit [Bacteroidales bacterium]|nr:efflux RND transporter periplasmic adaptor subunit [Bacteroidales bacterium]
MKRTIIITAIVVVVAIIAMIVISKLSGKGDLGTLITEVQQGDFEIVVTTTGELQAEVSTDIKGPEGLASRNMRFGGIKIQDLVPEGTEVKAGEYVATLDRSSVDNTLKDELDRQESYETELLKKQLDTTILMGNLRDDLVNLRFNMEESQITLEQSKYEPPTTIRQAKISLDKAERAYEQALSNYDLKVRQARADIRDTEIQLAKQRRKVNEMQDIIQNFVIKAPSAGMVIYKREWNGAKRKVGSEISPWDPVVATLPDLSSMISKTYVNEIDVSKVKTGQEVRLSVDAFPEKSYTGSVMSVANIGEQLPNTDAKVFEVITKVDGSDPILRPSMTTGNQIITKTFSDVIYIPLETVFATTDSIPFVYKKDGSRQVVMLGESNENDIIVEQGLNKGEKLYLSIPPDGDNFKLQGEELIAAIKDRKRQQLEEQKRQQNVNPRAGMMPSNMTPEQMREYMQNLTPEQRESMRQMRGAGAQGTGQGRTGSTRTDTTATQQRVVIRKQ